MKRFAMAAFAGLALIAWSPQARADISMQDFALNVNGTAYDWNNVANLNPLSPNSSGPYVPGMNASAFDPSMGLGKLTFTFNPGAPGSYFVNFYIDEQAGIPFYNEYGMVNGSAPAGMSWEIAQVNPSVGGITFFTGTSQTLPNTLSNTNNVPVGNTNYLNNCATAPCNADVASALGFNFTLAAGEEAVITLDSSTSAPGGFYLEQVHPIDATNTAAVDLFLSGSISIQPATTPPPPPVPEPRSWFLLGTVLVIMGCSIRRKFARS